LATFFISGAHWGKSNVAHGKHKEQAKSFLVQQKQKKAEIKKKK
jgi:hypothetical protein